MLIYCVWHGLKGKILDTTFHLFLFARGRPRKEVKVKLEKVKEETKKETKGPMKKVDEIRPNAICKMCQGNMNHNRAGQVSCWAKWSNLCQQYLASLVSLWLTIELQFQPEMLLHCSKCNSSCHPTCVGLSLDLISYVTSYEWECTDCKQCMKCQASHVLRIELWLSWCLGLTLTYLLHFAILTFTGSCWWGQNALLRPLRPGLSHLLRWTQSDPQR